MLEIKNAVAASRRHLEPFKSNQHTNQISTCGVEVLLDSLVIDLNTNNADFRLHSAKIHGCSMAIHSCQCENLRDSLSLLSELLLVEWSKQLTAQTRRS